MTNTSEESCTDDLQISGLVKKKKKKRRRLDRETHGQPARAGFCSPLSSDHSSIFSWRFDDQASEGGKTPQKKTKKKARQEKSDSRLDYSCVTTESELISKAGIEVCKPKKKKQRKLSPIEPDDGNPLGVPLRQGKASSQPRADGLGTGDWTDGGTPVRKKRAKTFVAKQDEASKVSAGPLKNRTDPTSSDKHEEASHSSAEDSQVELFTSSPCKTQHSSLSHKKAATNLATSTELDSPIAPRKPHKHKKSSSMKDSDSTDVTPRKPSKHRKSSDVKDSDSTDVTPRKPSKHKKSSGVEDSYSSNVGFEVEETVKSVTNHVQIKKESPAKRFPLEDSSELPKIPEDEGEWSSMELPASQSFFIEDNEFLDSSELVLPDLDTATQELEEFIPHVRNLSASAIKQLARRDLVRFKNFKQKGIAVKFGKFTKKENDKLRKNVEAFLQESGIESAEKLLFTHRFPEEKAAINKLKAQHLFGIRIAEGIPRPWRLVYYRARKIFDPNNYSGRYSDKEKRKLLEYQAMYGHNWKKISELMSRSSHSVALKYSQIKSEPKTGPWSKEETKRLIQAVEETLQANCKVFSLALEEEDDGKALSLVRENLYKGISWMKVEAKVGTRHWRQCKQKWISIVTKRMSGGQVMAGGAQNLQFKINLIERLYELNVEDANEVDWEVLSSIIGDVPPDYIQRRFYKLKATHVPFWNQKNFPEIIDHLYEVTLPKLKALLKSKKSGDAAKAQSTRVKEQRKVFQFQDIFQESSDELIEESEDELKTEGGMGGLESF